MEIDASMLLPPEVGVGLALGLTAISCFTSALTASAGIGGGITLVSIMASVLPPTIVLPVHGVVQLGSNFGRAMLLRKRINLPVLGLFTIGTVIGIAIAVQIFVALSKSTLQLLLGLFILYSIWTPKLRVSALPLWTFAPVGAVASFCTMFVGATGPFVAAFISPHRYEKEAVVATHGACLSVQHVVRTIAFGFIGFNYWPWLLLIAAMVVSGFLGTIIGRNILIRIPEHVFKNLFRIVLTVLAVRLLWVAFSAWASTSMSSP